MSVKVAIQIGEMESGHLPNEMLQLTGQDRQVCGSYRLTKREVGIGRPKSGG